MTVRTQYEADLTALKAALVEMGQNSADAVEAALEALCTADAAAADAIVKGDGRINNICLLYTSPSPRDRQKSRMPSSA